ncbi:hypothetical protein [Phytoactinopolyspora limicola]|uniref:hypothetical protein n=1 Tax=Phytoactinopolyspora limicola TaxID=2715536 RepID=UPI00140827A6|nr:hypothetical protein [Phytoactinopolyspora limicola]
MILTAGMSASAATVPSREHSGTYQQASEPQVLAGMADLPGQVLTAAQVSSGPDVAVPPSTGTTVDPRDLYPLPGLMGRTDVVTPSSATHTPRHTRGPPVSGQH